jgi:hypothetical protein
VAIDPRPLQNKDVVGLDRVALYQGSLQYKYFGL